MFMVLPVLLYHKGTKYPPINGGILHALNWYFLAQEIWRIKSSDLILDIEVDQPGVRLQEDQSGQS